MEQKPRNRILIVGGGTAGWLSAAYLAKKLDAASPEGVSVSLIESPLVPSIGVGEGTLPSLRLTLATIGVDEADFMRACGATFKQGILFRNWFQDQAGASQDYFHPFNSPRQLGGIDLSPYWLAGQAAHPPYAEAITPQAAVCQAKRAPKRLSDPSYSGPMNYAYHLDVNLLAEFLQKTAIDLGVKHYKGHVSAVHRGIDDNIQSVQTDAHGLLEADLFIDCTGFKSLLIEGALGTSFTPIDDILFCDRALAVPVAYPQDDAPLPSTTISSAQSAGWTWDIALRERRGVGYVYSSRHTSDAEAEVVLANYVGDARTLLDPRMIKFRTGYRKVQWRGNCIAVGLSAGFLEPLESTGILMVEAAAHLIADFYPLYGSMKPVAEAFNRAMRERFEAAIDFLKMHFCLSNRPESEPFWRDNRAPDSLPQSLKDYLEMWQYRLPSQHDLRTVHDSFRHINYEYILLGMGLAPKSEYTLPSAMRVFQNQAQAEFRRIEQAGERAVSALPDHRALITQLQEARFAGAGATGFAA